MQRRSVLKAAASALLVPVLLPGCRQSAPQRLGAFGLQLSTVTDAMLVDFEGTLARVAEIGYRQVEFSAMGFLGRDPEHVSRLLAENELEAPLGRVTPRLPEGFFGLPRNEARKVYFARSQPQFFLDNVTHSLESAIALDQRYLILPALGPSNFTTLEQVNENISLINQAGDLCARKGVVFGYHNHNWELRALDGVVPYDLMIEKTDPAQVTFQLDAYWIRKGGGDLSDYLRRYAGRFSTCHLKDIDEAGDFADVGDGLIDFPMFVREALNQGTQYFFVERDNPPEPYQSARRSFAYLQQMTF